MPTTPEGKAISSRNALKHGLNSATNSSSYKTKTPKPGTPLLNRNNPGIPTRNPLRTPHHPRNSLRKMAPPTRLAHRKSLMNNEMDNQAEDLDTKYEDLKETSRQGFAFRSLSDNSKSFANLDRYQTRLERAYHRAVKGLRELRENRKQKISKRTPVVVPDNHDLYPISRKPRR